ncbi:unnamed protein product, partial [Amoebophrya sp. A25]|eukprot:GSA25T00011448001.1
MTIFSTGGSIRIWVCRRSACLCAILLYCGSGGTQVSSLMRGIQLESCRSTRIHAQGEKEGENAPLFLRVGSTSEPHFQLHQPILRGRPDTGIADFGGNSSAAHGMDESSNRTSAILEDAPPENTRKARASLTSRPAGSMPPKSPSSSSSPGSVAFFEQVPRIENTRSSSGKEDPATSPASALLRVESGGDLHDAAERSSFVSISSGAPSRSPGFHPDRALPGSTTRDLVSCDHALEVEHRDKKRKAATASRCTSRRALTAAGVVGAALLATACAANAGMHAFAPVATVATSLEGTPEALTGHGKTSSLLNAASALEDHHENSVIDHHAPNEEMSGRTQVDGSEKLRHAAMLGDNWEDFVERNEAEEEAEHTEAEVEAGPLPPRVGGAEEEMMYASGGAGYAANLSPGDVEPRES